jgi:hypothetical protein
LGPRHPDTLACAGNYAVTLSASNWEAEATALQRQVLASMVDVLGANHPDIEALRRWRPQSRELEPPPT